MEKTSEKFEFNFDKKKVLIWGFAEQGKNLLMQIPNDFDFSSKYVGFVDSNVSFWGKTYMGLPVYSPLQIKEIDFDYIVIATVKENIRREIYQQIVSYGISVERILDMRREEVLGTAANTTYLYRHAWLKGFAEYVSMENIQGNVAECGVFRGDYSKFLSEFFPNRKLYLFDTFEGFSDSDLEVERNIGDDRFVNNAFNDKEIFNCTNEELVLNKINNKEMVNIKKGFFPETAIGLDDKFCFVHLDMDLYQPIYAGLEFFYEKMYGGGVIVVHDYNTGSLPGVRKAIKDYEKNYKIKLAKFPIGDYYSIAILKI